MIYEVKMYAGKCDNCGEDIRLGGGEYSAYMHRESVAEEMMNSEWHTEDGKAGQPDKHYCPDCHRINDDDEIEIIESRKKHNP